MKNRKRGGFTLAEMLAVVAILIILFAVIAVNVVERQRSMTRLEFDAIAKEIFIAAQNHLIVAESQGYLGLSEADDFGERVTEEKTDESGKTYQQVTFHYDSTDSPKIREQMLPPYAVDYGGTFVISYQAHPARVLDVYYSLPGKSSLLTVTGTKIVDDDFSDLEAQCKGDANTKNRERFTSQAGTGVVGWYGGDGAQTQGVQLEVPTFEIHNEEQLYVKVFDPNVGKKSIDGLNNLSYNLKLVVKGKSSKAEKYFSLLKNGNDGSDINLGRCVETDGKKEYSILLDDVVDGLHFAQLTADKGTAFTAGEDLEIFVVAYSSTELTNIAKSDSKFTNSLFADPAPYTAGETVTGTDVRDSTENGGTVNIVAGIANFRHLENLDGLVSGLDKATMQITMAAQTSDMDWTAEWKDWKGAAATWKHITLNDNTVTGGNCFYPVSPDYILTYNGNPPKQGADSDDPATAPDYRGRVIKNVKVDYSGSAGLFGTLISESAVNDLELVDFSVTASSGNAGALIGTADGVTVKNVLARNSKGKDNKTTPTVTATSGAAGGLIGSMTNGSVTNCAAALIVKSTDGSAGGLIGTSSAEVSNSYAGGHTDGSGRYSTTDYNVIGATAGGLIGTSSGKITNCYSTCSASGTTAAGGLIGTSSGSKVSTCYATGLVEAPAGSAGALVGSGAVTDNGGNRYLRIINQDQVWHKTAVKQFKQSGGNEALLLAGIASAVDVTKSTADYNSFFNGTGPAQPYDAKLLASYAGKYPMPCVKDMGASLTNQYVSTHYGDWPMPETLVVNVTN